MKVVYRQFWLWMLLLSCAAAQSTGGSAVVQNVSVTHHGQDLQVEITLSSPVAPVSSETAVNPDRILLDLPGTTCTSKTRSVAVNRDGLLRVRTGQHSTNPLVTRVVLDLDQVHPYTVSSEGNRIIVTVSGAENANSGGSHGAPAAATSGSLISIFRRPKQETPAPITDNTSGAGTSGMPAPPPSVSTTASAPAASPSAPTTPAPPPAVAKVMTEPAPAPTPATTPVPPPSVASNSSTPAFPSAVPNTPAAPPSVAPAAPTNSVPAAATPSTAPAPPPAVSQPAPVVAESSPAPVSPAPTTPAPAVPEATPSNAAAPETTAESAAPSVAEPAPVTPPSAAPAPETTAAAVIARSDDPSLRTVFRVKYVAEGVAYLEGGRAQGLAEGMKLLVEDTGLPARQGQSANAADPRVVAELEVTAVAETSAVTDIHTPKRPVKAGDLAYLSNNDAEAMVQQRTLSATRQYPAVISFTEGDTLDEEARQEVPRPPPPSVNRARGRIGMDYLDTVSHGVTSVNSSDIGVVFRGDITRIGGTYWNLSGYWRGRVTKESAAAAQTLQNVINRTYHLYMTYDNPNSSLVAGFGRLYLPWAPSLDTIDGGYFGFRPSKGSVVGVFAGSTPDPSSWDYSPDRIIGGAFVNFDGGAYDAFHYSATTGAGISMVNWAIDRPFVFIEDVLSYKRIFAIYESAQFDAPRGNVDTTAPGPGLGRDFFTFRVNPHPRLEFDLNYTYFRDVPTFDPTLVGTGLLDKYLFQGGSVGTRLEVVKQVFVSAQIGRSNRSGDGKASLNEMYGITAGRLPWHMRATANYARFDSTFGKGSYESAGLSRQISDRLRLEALVGQQNFLSTLTTVGRSRFITGTVETTLGPHYYIQSSFTTNRGELSYDQYMFSLGYRFDNRKRERP